MKTDLYTKVVLTIIAICLTFDTIHPLITPKTAQAGGIIPVNIEAINGRSLFGNHLPVKVENSRLRVEVDNTPLSVRVE